MEFIEEDLIQAASIAKAKNRKSNWIKWGVLAACVCLLVVGSTQLYQRFLGPENATHSGNEGNVGFDGDNFVTVPAIELPKNTNGSAMDMIALIVYQNRIYTQSIYYDGEEASQISDLVDTYLGYAKGNIDEWSSQEEYSKELAATVMGDVYTVKGYDSEFRLCIKGQYNDENGNTIEYVNFYDHLNGISLGTGKDLFGDRLQLMNQWDYAKYQEHQNWDTGWPNYEYHDLSGVTDADLEAFLTQLYSSEFVDLSESNIYDKEQGHLYFYMKDGTNIPLRLMEGGYVSYQPLGWYFVKMPGEIFDKIYNAIQPSKTIQP
jgi:hypothetical protein